MRTDRLFCAITLGSSACLLSSCQSEIGDRDYWEEPSHRKPLLRPTSSFLAVADPKLNGFISWPLEFELVHAADQDFWCDFRLNRQGAHVYSVRRRSDAGRCILSWNGRTADGRWLPRGAVSLTVVATPMGTSSPIASLSVALEVVRLGVREVNIESDARVPLLYSGEPGTSSAHYELPADLPIWKLGPGAEEPDAASVLDLYDGAPRPLPERWTDPRRPPSDPYSPDGVEHDAYSLPVALVAGKAARIEVVMSSDSAPDPTSPATSMPAIRMIPPASLQTTTEPIPFSSDTAHAFDTADSLAPDVGVYVWPLEWTFEYQLENGAWRKLPGEIRTEITVYGVVDFPTFSQSTAPYLPWVEVVDTVAVWVGGTTRDSTSVAQLIADGIYGRLNLVYDRDEGASYYSEFDGGWEWLTFDMTVFSRRNNGNRVNCMDTAALLTTWSNMMGIALRYHILEGTSTDGFDLNAIRLIGWDDFDDTPFTSGVGSFRYHVMAGDSAGHMYDATLELDKDEAPSQAPYDAYLPAGIAESTYLADLATDPDALHRFIDGETLLE